MQAYKSDTNIPLKNCMLVYDNDYNYVVCDITKDNPAKYDGVKFPNSIGACYADYRGDYKHQATYWLIIFEEIFYMASFSGLDEKMNFINMIKGLFSALDPKELPSLKQLFMQSCCNQRSNRPF